MSELLPLLLTGSIELSVLFLAGLLVERLVGRRYPRFAALLWLLIMLKPLITLFLPATISLPLPPITSQLGVPVATVSEVIVGVHGSPGLEPVVKRETELVGYGRALGFFWLTGALLMFFRLVRDRRSVAALIEGSAPAPPHIADLTRVISRELGVWRAPEVRLSREVPGPAVTGWLIPTILLPGWFESDVSDADLRWSLRHELMHVRTFDTTSGLVSSMLRTIYWFHPLAWLAGSRWERCVERACDHAILSDERESVDYADTLYRLLLRVQAAPRHEAGLFAVRSSIGSRIEQLLRPDSGAARIGFRGTIATLVMAVPLFLFGAGWPQSPSYGAGTIEEVRDGVERNLEYRGSFERGIDGTIARIDGWMTLSESGPDEGRAMVIRGDGDRHERDYSIGGRDAPYDAAARAWEVSMLRELE